MGNKQGAGASRSVGIKLVNATQHELELDDWYLYHGKWTDSPPKSIAANSSESWMAESDGFMTGTEGKVYFKVNQIQ